MAGIGWQELAIVLIIVITVAGIIKLRGRAS